MVTTYPQAKSYIQRLVVHHPVARMMTRVYPQGSKLGQRVHADGLGAGILCPPVERIAHIEQACQRDSQALAPQDLQFATQPGLEY